jgi:hypothetical protein
MHVARYDRGFSRRHFLGQIARGVLATGVIAPLWRVMAQHGDAAAAYPDELLSIEELSRGRLAPGDEITADNVELVRGLLDPIRYQQIATMGRRLRLASTTTDLFRLSPRPYLEATFRNRGQARFDELGNVVTGDGEPWIGGHPFPDPQSGLELFAGLTMSWGRHDAVLYPVKQYNISSAGAVNYEYESVWAELHPVGRVSMDPKPWWPEHKDKLRFQSVIFEAPADVRGTSYLNIWPYDQNLFPELHGYLPAFRRIRQFPTSQRFEPLVPGSSLYLSDAWAAGDPLHTWGNYRIVDRGPMLAAVSGGWHHAHPNWQHPTHGGPQGETFWDTTVELVPEAICVEAEPLRFPRAPVSRKRVWFDARTLLPINMVSYDRRGEVYRSFDGAYALYEHEDMTITDGTDPYWSWAHVHAFDIQTSHMTRLEQVREVRGGHGLRVNDPEIYDRYLTTVAMRRYGA